MLEIIQTGIALAALIGVIALALVFRAEVRQLVNWIVGFKHISKTKDGFAIGPQAEPDSGTTATASKVLGIAVIEETIPETTSDSTPAAVEVDTWWKASREKRHADAVFLMQKEVDSATSPDQKLLYRSLIGHELFQEDPKKGIEHFEKLIVEEPTSSTIYDWYALTYLWADLLEKSLEVIARGLPNVTDKGELLATQASVFRKAGRDDQAYESALEGVKVSPANTSNYLFLADIETARKRLDEARTWYKRALSVSNNNTSVLATYGEWLTANGFYAESLLRYLELVARKPDNATYQTLLGNAYLNNNAPDLALEAYFAADKLAEGKQGWILGNIGNIYNNAGLYSLAESYLRRALAVDPDSEYALDALNRAVKAKASQNKEVQKTLDEARSAALLPASPPAPKALAAINTKIPLTLGPIQPKSE